MRRIVASVLAGLLLAACGDGDAASTAPTPDPRPVAASAPAAPAPVALEHRVEAVSVSATDVLSKDRGVTPPREPMDPTSVDAIAGALVTLLRTHLDDLNAGGPGSLDEAADRMLAADPSVAELLRGHLASADNAATSADLLLRLGVDGVPQWAAVALRVLRADGSEAGVELVFSTDGELELLVAGRAGGGAR